MFFFLVLLSTSNGPSRRVERAAISRPVAQYASYFVSRGEECVPANETRRQLCARMGFVISHSMFVTRMMDYKKCFLRFASPSTRRQIARTRRVVGSRADDTPSNPTRGSTSESKFFSSRFFGIETCVETTRTKVRKRNDEEETKRKRSSMY